MCVVLLVQLSTVLIVPQRGDVYLYRLSYVTLIRNGTIESKPRSVVTVCVLVVADVTSQFCRRTFSCATENCTCEPNLRPSLMKRRLCVLKELSLSTCDATGRMNSSLYRFRVGDNFKNNILILSDIG